MEISAFKGIGIYEASKETIKAVNGEKLFQCIHFSGVVKHVIVDIVDVKTLQSIVL